MSCDTTVSCLNCWRSLRPLDGTDKTRWLEMAKNNKNQQRRAQSQRDKARNKQQPRQRRSGITSTVVANRAYVGSMPGPRMRATNGGGMMVCNTESGPDVASSSTSLGFNTATVPLIPTNFTWLRGVALSFSKYRWNRLRLFYLPAVGSSTAGRVASSLIYDGADLTPANLAAIIAGNRSTFGPVWAGQSGFDSSNPFANHSDMIHLDLDCSKLDKKYYPTTTLSNYNGLSSSDKNIYCPASLLVGADAIVATAAVVGSFYITYEIEFVEPVASPING
nr:MAG: putative coat protein [Hubei sclerotinia RNA virus 1-WX]